MPDSDAEPPSTGALPETVMSGAEPLQESAAQLNILFEQGDAAVPDGLTEAFVRECCQTALSGQSLLSLSEVATIELSIQLLDKQAIRELNHQYRDKDRATNVLSFAAELPLMMGMPDADEESPAGGLLVLGDLVLCPEVVADEAQQQGKALLDHWAHMLVHGTLHLCGHDHEVEQEAQLMEASEIRLLSGLGIPNPYASENAVNGQ